MKTKKLPLPVMMARLDLLYSKEEELKKQMCDLVIAYDQLQEDKDMLQTMIMYKSNREQRKNGITK